MPDAPTIPRHIVMHVCRLLGYDPHDVAWIRIQPDSVTVATLTGPNYTEDLHLHPVEPAAKETA